MVDSRDGNPLVILNTNAAPRPPQVIASVEMSHASKPVQQLSESDIIIFDRHAHCDLWAHHLLCSIVDDLW